MNIYAITRDPAVEFLIRELVDGADQIESWEVSLYTAGSGCLDRCEVNRRVSLSSSEFNAMQNALFRADLLPHCRQELQSIPEISHEPYPAIQEVLLEGDPGMGRVFQIRDIHPIEEATIAQRAAIGRYQFRLLEELMASGSTDVVEENLSFDIPPGHPNRHTANARRIRGLFPGGQLPEPPSEEQINILFEEGAVFAYACLNEESVTIHRSIDRELRQPIERMVASGTTRGQGRLLRRMNVSFANHLLDIAEAHHNSDIYMTVGTFHDLVPALLNLRGQGRPIPTLISIRFDELTQMTEDIVVSDRASMR